ncbi:hypothetical protein [Photobacterium sp. TLY01]|uniref:hypothetical protein n=1 Tax=Photobacterium sp. TLY01 TaxID=2907534 RepID=UPI001F2EB2D1|nr:hypothetical protein [Photobacterium sp. TLY01]UIP29878.1 hypothetical protein LN341_20170 [Photobacterium sp. TLY01]
MKGFKLVLLFLLPVIIVGKEYLPSFMENQQLEDLKEQFQSLLFDQDSKVKVTSIRMEDNVIALKVNVLNVELNEKNKESISRNSRELLPGKICNSAGLSEWLANGKWISIDVTANGTKAVTNVRVTYENCT